MKLARFYTENNCNKITGPRLRMTITTACVQFTSFSLMSSRRMRWVRHEACKRKMRNI